MQTSRQGLFKKSLPLVLSELSEAMLLLTGVIYMSWEDEKFLAAIGMIDAALLCCLAYGFSLTDSFQRFYARKFATGSHLGFARQVLWQSLVQFVVVGLLVSLAGLTVVLFFAGIYQNELLAICLQATPWVIAMIMIYHLALPFHAFLIGRGYIRLVGWLAFSSVIVNAGLIALILHIWNWDILPTNAVLFSGLVAESIWFILLLGICCYKGYFSFLSRGVFRGYRIYRVIHRAAIYPGFSLLLFHLGSSLLFVYLSWCCADRQVASLTLILGFWSVLIAPVNGMADAANNDFAGIYSRNKMTAFKLIRKQYLQVALIISSVIYVGIAVFNFAFASEHNLEWHSMALVGILVILTAVNKFDFAALLVRLKNNSFALIKLVFGLSVIAAVVSFERFFNLEISLLLLMLLIAQVLITHFLHQLVGRLWKV